MELKRGTQKDLRLQFGPGSCPWYPGQMGQQKSAKAEENFEQTLERLQGLVRELESGECSLEDSLKKFEEGMALARGCQERLNAAEQKIELLIKADKNGISTSLFESE